MERTLPGLSAVALLFAVGACAGEDTQGDGAEGDAIDDFDVLADMASAGGITGVTEPFEAGTITAVPGSFGVPTTLTATANPGYRFVRWSGCSVATLDANQAASTTLRFDLVLLPETCVAHFEQEPAAEPPVAEPPVAEPPVAEPTTPRVTISYDLPPSVQALDFQGTDPAMQCDAQSCTVAEGADFSFKIRVPFLGTAARPRLLPADCGTSPGGTLGNRFERIDGDALVYELYMNDTRVSRHCALAFLEGAVVRGSWPAGVHVTPTFTFKSGIGQVGAFPRPPDNEFHAVFTPGDWAGFGANAPQGSWRCTDGSTASPYQPSYVRTQDLVAGQFVECAWTY